MLVPKMGYEGEAWVFQRGTQNPADVASLIAELNGSVPKEIGKLTREPGQGSIEFVGAPAGSPCEASTNIITLARLVRNQGYHVDFRKKSPFPHRETGPQVVKSRYKALWGAALQEVLELGGTEEDWKLLGVMNSHAATHAHYSFQDVEISYDRVDDRIVFVMNVLNHIGPRIARALCIKYGVDNSGHLGIWAKWARPQRFTRYKDWAVGFADLKRQFEAIPRLIKCLDYEDKDPDWIAENAEWIKENGNWVIDLNTPQSWREAGDHGTWWHFVRARPCFGTFEIRLMPSWPLESLSKVMADLHDAVMALMEIAPFCVDFENAHELFGSRHWTDFRKRHFAETLGIPKGYSKDEWNADVFH